MSIITKINLINPSSDALQEKASFILHHFDLHDQLTDHADWDAKCWDFNTDFLLEYAIKLKKLHEKSDHGFEFQAIWSGDKIGKSIHLTLDEFIDVIRENQIETSSKYIIKKPNIKENTKATVK